jgi:hypothetical protein
MQVHVERKFAQSQAVVDLPEELDEYPIPNCRFFSVDPPIWSISVA